MHVSTFSSISTRGLALIALLCASASCLAQGRGIDARQELQQTRIERGAAQGDLTRCEARRLEARGQRIERREQRYRDSGGLQPVERVRLHRDLDRLSGDIAEQRRDGRGCW